MSPEIKSFADYKSEAASWITLASGEYYPDILEDACNLYKPVLVLFGKILKSSESSKRLFMNICDVSQIWMRIQLCRVFRKYTCPETPVEMLKKKTKVKEIIENFGSRFRPIQEVHRAFDSRPIPDEALCAVLWEYKARGQKGYDLTEKFFELFQSYFTDLTISGPPGAGKDIFMEELFPDYPNPKRPVDFAIFESGNMKLLAIGQARYDSDRGGAQEDDRTGGYVNFANEFLTYTESKSLDIKLIFLNDGPGLLLGSMWDDYSMLEQKWPGKVKVVTLRMIPERITYSWIRSEE